MNENQLNVITQLQSNLSSVRDNTIENLTKEFDNAKNKIIETSDDPKKDGEEICSKLDEIKEEFETELKVVFEKLDKKLNSL